MMALVKEKLLMQPHHNSKNFSFKSRHTKKTNFEAFLIYLISF
jgi:hypothetical protein